MDIQNAWIQYRDKVVNIIIIIAAVFFAFKIYITQMKTITSLSQAKDVEMKKNELLKGIGEIEQKLNLYYDFVNKKSMTAIIDIIGDIAEKSLVKITSLRPAIEEEQPLYVKYPFDLRLEADSYHKIAGFISKIESHPDIFLIESAAITPELSQSELQPDKVVVVLRITTILLKR